MGFPLYSNLVFTTKSNTMNKSTHFSGHPINKKLGLSLNKTIYIAVGPKRDSKIEILGLSLGKNESAAFWMSVLTDIKARGV